MSMSKPSIAPQWQSLDGARALSILCVLACHLLPLGPKTIFDLNIAVGQFGMSIFFALSGFLIAHKLITERSMVEFAINRAFRIFPLLWLLLLISFAFRLPELSAEAASAHFLVLVNNLPHHYFHETEHLWSVCVEIHFYLIAGLCFFVFKRSGLALLMLVGVLLSLYRFHEQALFSTTTLFRLDELLIGLSLGLLWHSDTPLAQYIKRNLSLINPLYMFVGLAVVNLVPAEPLLFMLRPYIAALFIGSLMFNNTSMFTRIMSSKKWHFTSKHAYALYIIHPFLLLTWLSSGDKLTMYMKRPLLFIVLFVLAYLSTRYYEQFFIMLGKQWIKYRRTTKPVDNIIPAPANREPTFR